MQTTLALLSVTLLSALAIVFFQVLASPLPPSLSASVPQQHAAATSSPEERVATTSPAPKPVLSSTPIKSAPRATTSKPKEEKTEPIVKVVTIPATSTPVQPAATSDYAEETARIAFSLSNDERIEAGLSPLTWDASLAAIARAHSADMLARNYFEHVNPEGCSSSCRATNAGYSWRMIGENIYMTHGYAYGAAEEAETVVEGWMRSPGHKANILGAKYTHSGVGVAFQGDTAYITALYSLPR